MIVQINLLPKSYLKSDSGFKFGKAEIITFAVAALLLLAMTGLSWNQDRGIAKLDSEIAEAKLRSQMLQQDIALVDALMDMKKKIAERMQAVEKLDRHRSAWVRILEDVTRRVPDFVWLSSLQEVDPARSNARVDKPEADSSQTTLDGLPIRPIEIEGYAFTLNSLAAFMIKLMRSNFFDDVDLVYAKELVVEEKRAFNFKIQGRLHYLSDDELRKMIAADKELKLLARK